MDNGDTKLSKHQLDAVLSEIKEKKSEDKVDINGFIDKNLTPQQAEALNKALENPDQIKALLNSPQAKSLMKRLLGNKDNKQ